MKQEYELTQEQLDRLIEASKPVPYLIFGGIALTNPQEYANIAWAEIAEYHKVQIYSITPSPKGIKFFTATPIDVDKKNNEVKGREGAW